MWKNFFQNVKIFAFDNDLNLINKAKSENIENAHYFMTDVSDKTKLLETLKKF